METLTASTAEQTIDYELRAHNDAETWLAEVLKGSMRTPFEYAVSGCELYAEDGSPMGLLFNKSIHQAEELQYSSPELSFELGRRVHEWNEYGDMLAMTCGERPNTMVVVSDFPHALVSAEKDVGGYCIERKQTMLRVFTWNGERLQMYSQSLDRSDRPALEALYEYLGYKAAPGELLGQRLHLQLDDIQQELLADNLVQVYDYSLHRQYGGHWYAGRQDGQTVNTYDFVRRNQDLVELLRQEYAQGNYNSPQCYAVAATMAKRFATGATIDQAAYEHAVLPPSTYEAAERLQQEMLEAAIEARTEGIVFSGCGASVGSSNESADQQYDKAGYGNKSAEDGPCTFISKQCPKCGTKNVKTTVTKTHIHGSCGCTAKKK